MLFWNLHHMPVKCHEQFDAWRTDQASSQCLMSLISWSRALRRMKMKHRLMRKAENPFRAQPRIQATYGREPDICLPPPQDSGCDSLNLLKWEGNQLNEGTREIHMKISRRKLQAMSKFDYIFQEGLKFGFHIFTWSKSNISQGRMMISTVLVFHMEVETLKR